MVPRNRPYSNSSDNPVGKTTVYRVPPRTDVDPDEEEIEDRKIMRNYMDHHADRTAPGRDGELSFD